MRAFIYAGGSILADNITEHPKGDDLCIAADAGYRNAQELGERVNILIGDFDSLGTIPEGDMEVLQVPAEKDLTDTQIAVETALARGADEIILIGGLGWIIPFPRLPFWRIFVNAMFMRISIMVITVYIT
mgnify:CR=1 FL=1